MIRVAGALAVLAACGDQPMVVCWITRYGVEEPVYLREDYGVLVRWTGSENAFYFFDRPRGQVGKTDSLDRFLGWIGGLDRVEWIDKCCCPFSYGMNERELDMIRNRVRIGERLLICTCESNGLRIPSP